MRCNFEFVFNEVVGHEGGFTRGYHDRGNWTSGNVGEGELKGTKYGISAMAYPSLDIENLTLVEAREIYRRDYWTPIYGDRLPSGIDLFTFDAAVNQGITRAAKFLQYAAGVATDGIIGPITLGAVEDTPPMELLEEAAARRMHEYMLLDSLDDRYGLGWSRRLVDVVLTASEMIID